MFARSLFASAFLVCVLTASAQSSVTVTVDSKNPGAEMPPEFCGLSFEVALLMPDATTGKHYFRPDNQPLLNLFRTLGIKSLDRKSVV